jgi:hypothetical protein
MHKRPWKELLGGILYTNILTTRTANKQARDLNPLFRTMHTQNRIAQSSIIQKAALTGTTDHTKPELDTHTLVSQVSPIISLYL